MANTLLSYILSYICGNQEEKMGLDMTHKMPTNITKALRYQGKCERG